MLRTPPLIALCVLTLELGACCVRPIDPSRIAEHIVPEFELVDHAGVRRSLDDLLRHKYAVIVFYRGFW